jgi:hypothetical protein
MQSKLHFGILLILFAFLGRYIETSAVPNQQIVIQFSDTHITEFDVQHAIEDIQLKLQSVGVENTVIGQDYEGNLKITYYSSKDVKKIEAILSSENNFKIALSLEGENSKKDSGREALTNYKLNVSEIHKNKNTSDWDFDGVQIAEHNQKTDRFKTPKQSYSSTRSYPHQIKGWVNVALNSNTNSLVLIDNHSYKIPEVRAGPLS